MQKIIMFNGPPRAGKDTAGQICKHLLGEHAHLVKFTDVVKEETHRQLGLSCPNDAYEALKDTPLAEFAGLTPRAAYIETSTRMKREHGPHIVAEMTVQKLRGVNAPFIVNTDVGYDFEGAALRDLVGASNTVLVRLHRPQHDFSDDCRNWVHLPDVWSHDVRNDLDQSVLRGRLTQIVSKMRLSLDLVPAY